jgi:hypothetical protein
MCIPMMRRPMRPNLGGSLADAFSVRWIFFVDVPVGAVALLLSSRILPKGP